MSNSFSKNYGDTNFVTGMRAFAAFAVVLIHAGGAGVRLFGEIGNRAVDLCANGVTVFFVISGYSVASSYMLSKGYGNYLNKRFWRIAPLYYFWIVCAVLTATTAVHWQEQFHVDVDAYNLLMHISFLSFLDYKIAASILGVEWSIPIEVFWYFLVPLLLLRMKSHRQLIIGCCLGFASYVLVMKARSLLPLSAENAALAIHWSPIPFALSFCLGIAAYRLRESNPELRQWGDMALFACIAALNMFVMTPLSKSTGMAYVFFSSFTFILILFGSNESRLFRWLLTNKVAIFLGTISYGIYLCHLPLLAGLSRLNIPYFDDLPSRFIILSACVVLVSTVTYYVIERPTQQAGKLFYRRLLNPFIEQPK